MIIWISIITGNDESSEILDDETLEDILFNQEVAEFVNNPTLNQNFDEVLDEKLIISDGDQNTKMFQGVLTADAISSVKTPFIVSRQSSSSRNSTSNSNKHGQSG